MNMACLWTMPALSDWAHTQKLMKKKLSTKKVFECHADFTKKLFIFLHAWSCLLICLFGVFSVHDYVAAEMDIQAKGVDDENEEEKNVDSETRAVAHFIQYMKDNGFSEQLAVKAIKADISPTDLDDGR